MCGHFIFHVLYAIRCRGQKFRMNETYLLDGKNPNPFAERPSTALLHIYSTSAHKAALNDLDKLSNAPDGLDSSVWSRLCQYRRSKVDMENNVSGRFAFTSDYPEILSVITVCVGRLSRCVIVLILMFDCLVLRIRIKGRAVICSPVVVSPRMALRYSLIL